MTRAGRPRGDGPPRPPRPDYGPWSLLLAGMVAVLLGRRLAFTTAAQVGDGWELGHFTKELGVFLMFAGMLTWLAAAGLLMVRLARWGRL